MCYGASKLGAKTLKASFKLCGFLLISWDHNILLSRWDDAVAFCYDS